MLPALGSGMASKPTCAPCSSLPAPSRLVQRHEPRRRSAGGGEHDPRGGRRLPPLPRSVTPHAWHGPRHHYADRGPNGSIRSDTSSSLSPFRHASCNGTRRALTSPEDGNTILKAGDATSSPTVLSRPMPSMVRAITAHEGTCLSLRPWIGCTPLLRSVTPRAT